MALKRAIEKYCKSRGLVMIARPRGARKLSGYEDVYRVRVGSDRVLYSVSDEEIVVIVLKLGHRKDVYR